MSRSAASLIHILNQHRLRIFSTADFLTLTGLKASAGVQALRRLARQGVLAKLKRGVWINKLVHDINPYEAVPFLVSPWTGYVSLTSALSDHGLISEIPQTIYAVSSGRPARIIANGQTFQIQHLPSRLMWGYEMQQAGPATFPMADPEKAFLDQVYLALVPRSSVRLPVKRGGRWKLDKERLQEYANRFQFPALFGYLKQNRLIDGKMPAR